MKKIVTILSMFISLYSFGQSGWTQPDGKYYFKSAVQLQSSDKHFDTNGNRTSNVKQNIFAINNYLEFGITDKTTLIGFIPTFVSFSASEDVENTVNPQDGLNLFGDVEVGLKRRIFKNNRIATALTARLRLPTGGGEFNQSLILSAGIPIWAPGNFNFYGNAYGGANNRGRGFSAEKRYGFELGIGYKGKAWLIFKQDNILSFDNKKNANDELANQLFGNNFENQTYMIEASYFLNKKMGISINYVETFAGQLTLDAPTINVGLFWNPK